MRASCSAATISDRTSTTCLSRNSRRPATTPQCYNTRSTAKRSNAWWAGVRRHLIWHLGNAKSAETLDQPELPLGDRKNMIFMGTSIAAGSGHAVVVATGMQTEIGGIATLIGDAGEDKGTPLQRKLEAFGRLLLWATLAIVVLLFGLGLARGTELFELFLTSVSLAVAALPESLPAVVTAALSIWVLRMSRRRAFGEATGVRGDARLIECYLFRQDGDPHRRPNDSASVGCCRPNLRSHW